MALFRRKKSEEKIEKTAKAPVSTLVEDASVVGQHAHVLRSPRITEKASDHQSLGVYTFDVSVSATKRSIAATISALYKVVPRKVRIVTVPSKQKRSVRTGARGVTRRGKKAYVYFKKGDTITLT
ncbi:50S ribosomal protein L23 [Candidatus Kaiserbacteria bacterium]|nr:50S ribosomal protein L23 [Candidatus Kaiserbacteria bacterium]